jgi:hypothetical protein
MVPSTLLSLDIGGGEPAETAVLGLAFLLVLGPILGLALVWLQGPVRRLDPLRVTAGSGYRVIYPRSAHTP